MTVRRLRFEASGVWDGPEFRFWRRSRNQLGGVEVEPTDPAASTALLNRQ
jgi:hypothetical protein